MRPDLDDFEELNDDAPRSRAMSWLVLVVAVGGFAALAYYAYHSGSQSVRDGQVVVIQADQTPIKESPADPQGEAFPNQDKTIYDAIDPSAQRGKVEKLLPEAEEPVIPQPAVEAVSAPTATHAPHASDDSTTTFVNKSLTKSEPSADPVDVQSLKQPGPALAPEPKTEHVLVEPTDENPTPVPVIVTTPKAVAKPAPVPTVKPVSAAAPSMVNVKPAKPAPAPAAAPSGAYKIQLGAYKSDAEARQQWAKISAKHGDVVKGSPIIVKADVKGSIFYRLRASGFASADAAKAACAKLSGRGQACFFAGK